MFSFYRLLWWEFWGPVELACDLGAISKRKLVGILTVVYDH